MAFDDWYILFTLCILLHFVEKFKFNLFWVCTVILPEIVRNFPPKKPEEFELVKTGHLSSVTLYFLVFFIVFADDDNIIRLVR